MVTCGTITRAAQHVTGEYVEVAFVEHALVLEKAMELLDTVAMLQDFPPGNLVKGQVGAIVEELDANNVLVEFADIEGVAYAISPIAVAMLLKLKHTPLRPSSAYSTVAKPSGS